MNNEDHERFLQTCLESKAMILICGYDCDLYNILTDNGWKKHTFEVKMTSGSSGKTKTKLETIWYNY